MSDFDESFLDLLPNEVLALVLDFIHIYRDLFNVSYTQPFAHLCDWNFWKQKALKELEVDNWYFDLPISQNREICGKDRFLEILSKFEIFPESVARIEEGEVTGIYFEGFARHLAEEQGNVRMFKPLEWRSEFEIYRQSDIRRLPYYESDVDFHNHFQWQCYDVEQIATKGEMRAFGFFTSGPRSLKLFHGFHSTNKIMEEVSKCETEKDYRIILDNSGENYIEKLAHITYKGCEISFPILEEKFKLMVEQNKMKILSFSIASGKPKQFSRLFDLSPSLGFMDYYTLSCMAFGVADPEIIEIMEERGRKKGISLSFEDKHGSLIRSLSRPRPIKMYRIAEKMIQKGEIDEIGAFFWDIDILMLMEKEGIDPTKGVNLLECETYPVSFVKYLISKLNKQQKEKYRQQIDDQIKADNYSYFSVLKRLLQ